MSETSCPEGQVLLRGSQRARRRKEQLKIQEELAEFSTAA